MAEGSEMCKQSVPTLRFAPCRGSGLARLRSSPSPLNHAQRSHRPRRRDRALPRRVLDHVLHLHHQLWIPGDLVSRELASTAF